MGLTDITGSVKSSKKVIPMVYAYTTPEVLNHNGWTKIGYTEAQTVEERIAQQTHTADIQAKLEWKGAATFDDGTGDTFTDHEFHTYLSRNEVERKKGTEWFHIDPDPAHVHFNDFRQNRGLQLAKNTAIQYSLRQEQDDAVTQTLEYKRSHENGEYLWNAKPRFGKTLSVYDFCLRDDAKNVLILTNRPAIADSWYNDYVKFVGAESGLLFVSHVDVLEGKKYCLTREQYLRALREKHNIKGCIEFVSLQDLKGSDNFGGNYDKLNEVAEIDWDVLVLDEAHEGVDTEKTDIALDHIKRKFTLNLSGTPFKMLATDQFSNNVFNWTYADEQARKHEQKYLEMGDESPYAFLPKLNMFTYQMSEMVGAEVKRGIDIDENTYAYFFDLNEFFKTKNGYFEHEADVDRFLDALATQTKYPFSTPELREELKHTFWLLDRVDSAQALKLKLNNHPVFRDYAVILAAGSGDDDRENKSAILDVRNAIETYDKTITLSVGQLTTGVTIPEWTAVMMLCNCKSPSLYMQAAFRAQNPCLFHNNGQSYRKENAYVFDFDPARTLDIFEQFANNLSPDTARDGGDSDTRKRHVRELLNFFPVIGEDDNGEMIELDAEKVLSIPRHIHAKEVVRAGFMSNFLFQNISNIFGAPKAVLDIINKSDKMKKSDVNMPDDDAIEDLNLNENGEVELSEEQVIGTAVEHFGNPIFGDITEEFDSKVEDALNNVQETEVDRQIAEVRQFFNAGVAKPIAERVKEAYGNDITASQRNDIQKMVDYRCNKEFNRASGDFKIKTKQLEKQKTEELEAANTAEERQQIETTYQEKAEEIKQSFIENAKEVAKKVIEDSAKDTVKKVEEAIRNKEKKTVEDDIRDHLRGFARTIPAFLMAYGNEETTLNNFDTIVPPAVFEEVTRNMTTGECITVEDFKKLRDGFDYTDEETGELKHYYGHLFDEVVFNDSIVEFMNKRKELANYFVEGQKEDIFSYIPPQRTNQIFTPKKVVKQMVDMFEEQNPGCFDDPEKTFADLYMKSGLYITEIIKRLFSSEGLKAAFPDEGNRLDHIVRHQVYGAAPTEIIYMIAMKYIFGFTDEIGELTAEQIQELHPNFKLMDTAELAKEGQLADWVEEAFKDIL